MFKSFKEKLKNWTKKLSESEESTEEIKPEKTPKDKSIKKEERKLRKEEKKKEKEERRAEKPKDIKKTEEKIESPLKFNPATKSYEPDLEKIQEIGEELEKEPRGTKGFFKTISHKKIKISEKEFEVYKEELEILLLENNVAFEVSEKIIDSLRKKIIGKEFLKKEAEEEINEILKEIIKEILVEPFDITEKIKEKKKLREPYVILFCGINGSGKTTSIAKISEMLKEKKISSVLAAGDTFRAASIEQLKKHGERMGVKVVAHDYGTDPASVGFDAIKYAKKNKIDCVLIDTAGRMHTERNLLKELEKVSRVCNPDLKIFVGESLTGNDAVEQAKTFNWHLGIDGSILTKADIDEKGGTALSIGFMTQKPILFLGTGQEYDKIEPFNKKKFVERLGL